MTDSQDLLSFENKLKNQKNVESIPADSVHQMHVPSAIVLDDDVKAPDITVSRDCDSGVQPLDDSLSGRKQPFVSEDIIELDPLAKAREFPIVSSREQRPSSSSSLTSNTKVVMRSVWHVVPVKSQTPPARHAAASAHCDNLWYAFGGKQHSTSTQNDGLPNHPSVGGTPLNDLWAFNPITLSWTEIHPGTTSDEDPSTDFDPLCGAGVTIPDPRWSTACVCVNNLFVVFGGCSTEERIFNDVWMIELTSTNLAWHLCESTSLVPAPRYHHTITKYGNGFIVMGGSNQYKSLADVWQATIDMVTGIVQWHLLCDDGPPLCGHSTVLYEDALYVFGGYNVQEKSGSSYLYRFDIPNRKWELIKTPNDHEIAPRYFHQAVQISHHMVILGGQHSPTSSTQRVDIFNLQEYYWHTTFARTANHSNLSIQGQEQTSTMLRQTVPSDSTSVGSITSISSTHTRLHDSSEREVPESPQRDEHLTCSFDGIPEQVRYASKNEERLIDLGNAISGLARISQKEESSQESTQDGSETIAVITTSTNANENGEDVVQPVSLGCVSDTGRIAAKYSGNTRLSPPLDGVVLETGLSEDPESLLFADENDQQQNSGIDHSSPCQRITDNSTTKTTVGPESVPPDTINDPPVLVPDLISTTESTNEMLLDLTTASPLLSATYPLLQPVDGTDVIHSVPSCSFVSLNSSTLADVFPTTADTTLVPDTFAAPWSATSCAPIYEKSKLAESHPIIGDMLYGMLSPSLASTEATHSAIVEASVTVPTQKASAITSPLTPLTASQDPHNFVGLQNTQSTPCERPSTSSLTSGSEMTSLAAPNVPTNDCSQQTVQIQVPLPLQTSTCPIQSSSQCAALLSSVAVHASTSKSTRESNKTSLTFTAAYDQPHIVATSPQHLLQGRKGADDQNSNSFSGNTDALFAVTTQNKVENSQKETTIPGEVSCQPLYGHSISISPTNTGSAHNSVAIENMSEDNSFEDVNPFRSTSSVPFDTPSHMFISEESNADKPIKCSSSVLHNSFVPITPLSAPADLSTSPYLPWETHRFTDSSGPSSSGGSTGHLYPVQLSNGFPSDRRIKPGYRAHFNAESLGNHIYVWGGLIPGSSSVWPSVMYRLDVRRIFLRTQSPSSSKIHPKSSLKSNQQQEEEYQNKNHGKELYLGLDDVEVTIGEHAEELSLDAKELPLHTVSSASFLTFMRISGDEVMDLNKTSSETVSSGSGSVFLPEKSSPNMQSIPTASISKHQEKSHKHNELGSISASIIIRHGDVLFQWKKERLIGSGSFGKVYLAFNVTDSYFMAAKEIEFGNVSRAELDDIKSEVGVMRALVHPNIVRYIGCSRTTPTLLTIFTELVRGGDLRNLISKEGVLQTNGMKRYCKHILSGLEYLHNRMILHRDIKAQNVLITDNGVAKLADFGLSVRGKVTNDNICAGTIHWMAPEVLRGEVATTKSDIWSVGCVLLEMATTNPPFHRMERAAVVFLVGDGRVKPELPDDLDDDLAALSKIMLAHDPSQRATAHELLTHVALRGSHRTAPSAAGSF